MKSRTDCYSEEDFCLIYWKYLLKYHFFRSIIALCYIFLPSKLQIKSIFSSWNKWKLLELENIFLSLQSQVIQFCLKSLIYEYLIISWRSYLLSSTFKYQLQYWKLILKNYRKWMKLVPIRNFEDLKIINLEHTPHQIYFWGNSKSSV